MTGIQGMIIRQWSAKLAAMSPADKEAVIVNLKTVEAAINMGREAGIEERLQALLAQLT